MQESYNHSRQEKSGRLSQIGAGIMISGFLGLGVAVGVGVAESTTAGDERLVQTEQFPAVELGAISVFTMLVGQQLTMSRDRNRKHNAY